MQNTLFKEFYNVTLLNKKINFFTNDVNFRDGLDSLSGVTPLSGVGDNHMYVGSCTVRTVVSEGARTSVAHNVHQLFIQIYFS